jgi:hypothetical protein
MEPSTRIELVTSPLPRERSAAELRGRTLFSCLANSGGRCRIRTYEGVRRQIYSLFPLATRATSRDSRRAKIPGPAQAPGPGPGGSWAVRKIAGAASVGARRANLPASHSRPRKSGARGSVRAASIGARRAKLPQSRTRINSRPRKSGARGSVRASVIGVRRAKLPLRRIRLALSGGYATNRESMYRTHFMGASTLSHPFDGGGPMALTHRSHTGTHFMGALGHTARVMKPGARRSRRATHAPENREREAPSEPLLLASGGRSFRRAEPGSTHAPENREREAPSEPPLSASGGRSFR